VTTDKNNFFVRANSPAEESAARLRGEREELFLQVV
jgi:hypothetical protein